jgi:putative Mg2+ transporter-C (MgtC) family protein
MSYITSVGLQFLSDSLYFLTDILPKLAVATVCGAIVGYDRERKHKTAGTRTMVLICTGCTLYTMIPFLLMAETSMMDIPIDPTRVIGQILTGIGFLGAGVIMKDNNKIIGVTTAAFIWVVAAIGVLIGVSDRPFVPIIMALSLVSVTNLFRKIEKNIKQKEDNAETGD